jgi:hypothetical protein
MDAREELKRWIAMVIELSSEEESKTIKQDIDLFLSVAGELSGKLADRNTALAKQCRSSSKSKPPKPAPPKGPKQQKQSPSSTDTPNSQNDSEDRSKAVSSIQQGILQADASLDDQQRNLRHFTYGENDDERSFRLAAKAISS